jgi:hypothetical protein
MRLARPVQQLLQRWQALQLDVCRARHAGEPQLIHHYVLGGAKLARLGVFDEVGVLRHMARTLLHTAHNPALPVSWCRACLVQLAAALNELRCLLGPRSASVAAAIEVAVRRSASLALSRLAEGDHADACQLPATEPGRSQRARSMPF